MLLLGLLNMKTNKQLMKLIFLQATQSAMHKGIKNVLSQLSKLTDINYDKILLLVDGNYFKPFTILNKKQDKIRNH